MPPGNETHPNAAVGISNCELEQQQINSNDQRNEKKGSHHRHDACQ